MRFSWVFLQNMLENGHSNLQTNLWAHITSNIFKISNSKITGWHQPPPDLPTLKAYPTPGVGGRFGIFSLKWRERMNLKVPGATLPLGCAILSTRARIVGGVGTTPLGELGLKYTHNVPPANSPRHTHTHPPTHTHTTPHTPTPTRPPVIASNRGQSVSDTPLFNRGHNEDFTLYPRSRSWTK